MGSGENSWEREKDMENTKEVVAKFKERLNAEVRQQEKLVKKRDFRRRILLGRYMAKMLYKQDNGKFEDEYVRVVNNKLHFIFNF